MVAQWTELYPRLSARGYYTTAIDGQVVYAYDMRMEEWRTLPGEVRVEYRRAYLRLHGDEYWGEGDGREEHHT